MRESRHYDFHAEAFLGTRHVTNWYKWDPSWGSPYDVMGGV